MNHRHDIDGLRAVAVIPVLLYHAGFGFSGGYVGVDVFFVISGFLITGLIVKEMDEKTFSLSNFWERRIRRILPALALMVIGALIGGWFVLMPEDYRSFGRSAMAQALLSSNIHFWRDSSYFAPAADLKPLLHTWSLAVEEQYYLIFPVFVMVIMRYSRRGLAPLILLVGLGSLVLSILGTYRYPSATFYLLPTRAWELMIGSFLALVRPPGSRLHSEWLSGAGMMAVIAAMFVYDDHTKFPGIAALLPCLGTAAIIWGNTRQNTLVARVLSTPPLVFVGLISYSLYLWHWPLLVFSGYWILDGVPPMIKCLALAASAALAVLSWKFVETPFRKRQFVKTRAQVMTFAAGSLAAIVLAGWFIFHGDGLPARWPEAVRSIRVYTPEEIERRFGFANIETEQARSGKFLELGTRDSSKKPGLLLWGDSHAMAVLPAIDTLSKENAIRSVGAMHFGWAPLLEDEHAPPGEDLAFNRFVMEFVAKQGIRDVLLVARWNSYVNADKESGVLRHRVRQTVSALTESGARVWILKQVPAHQRNLAKRLVAAVLDGRDPNAVGLTFKDHLQRSAGERSLFDQMDGGEVHILDPIDLFSDGRGACRVVENGKALYFDGDHLTDYGAMALRPVLEPVFAAVKAGPDTNPNGARSRE
jgi:peptidoglycan/LPS O-acetylase OafA/YrhL